MFVERATPGSRIILSQWGKCKPWWSKSKKKVRRKAHCGRKDT
jgi:hypothetical protein